MGHQNTFLIPFAESARQFAKNPADTLILEIGILAYLLGYVASTFLNAISTNYNMIAMSGSQPIAILFFMIFPKMNQGIVYPWYVSISCAILSVLTLMAWMRGERKRIQSESQPLIASKNVQIV